MEKIPLRSDEDLLWDVADNSIKYCLNSLIKLPDVVQSTNKTSSEFSIILWYEGVKSRQLTMVLKLAARAGSEFYRAQAEEGECCLRYELKVSAPILYTPRRVSALS